MPLHSSINLRATFLSFVFASLLAISPAARGQITATPLASPTTLPATMRLKKYAINDDQVFNRAIFQGIMPADWNVKGGVTWDMRLSTPDLLRVHWGDAKNVCAFDIYPYLTFCWGQQIQALGTPTYMGSIVQPPPSDQFDAIAKVIIPRFRPKLADAQVVDQQKHPEVAKAEYAKVIQMVGPGVAVEVWAGSETFEYEIGGQTVQEIVSLTLDESLNRRFGSVSWSISNANSVRAPKGSLDELKIPRTIIFQSIQANADWNQQVAALMNRRQQQLAVNQQNQFNQIESRIATQTAANDQQHQEFDQHMANLDSQSDAEADIQREVSPWKTSDGTTFKLPTQYGYAWSAADGSIIMNNDPLYNPNSDPNLTSSNWTPMQQAGN